MSPKAKDRQQVVKGQLKKREEFKIVQKKQLRTSQRLKKMKNTKKHTKKGKRRS